jgi:hypothetical protein
MEPASGEEGAIGAQIDVKTGCLNGRYRASLARLRIEDNRGTFIFTWATH